MRSLFVLFNFVRCIPHIVLFHMHGNKKAIHADAKRWLEVFGQDYGKTYGFVYLLSFYPEFRNLFYYRVGFIRYFFKFLCPELSTLYIHTPVIGEGLFIQHGFSTIINAESIGKNCWINQQVTIGFTNSTDSPTIKDNVTIYAGAKVLGNVTIGSNSVVGANAVVVKDVPENATVVGYAARVIKINGKSVRNVELYN
ncbi:serine O-acetyltransferase [Dyadobacter sp. CY326]|uniref:serine O-acetyltransferase n=1 Tax=Dyadobacter sp. CY326 TaxID=2907300 RepID=UPI001F4874CA|nr:serine acetyltransferase [Dyadobacter sp. CY326]MCE7066586.1 serine acetyltransferase [Dyadobacter sp. CY326]